MNQRKIFTSTEVKSNYFSPSNSFLCQFCLLGLGLLTLGLLLGMGGMACCLRRVRATQEDRTEDIEKY